jgi:pantetheine-phosphate adenylyltransferase
MKRLAIYPGSFDPVTNGHLDIIQRGQHLFDELIVAVTRNPHKSPFFSLEERITFLQTALRGSRRVKVETFSGLLIHYAQQLGASAIIRGLRVISDFEYEFQMALMNRRQSKRFETVFLMPDEKYTYISSSLVREISLLGGDVKGLVPSVVEKALKSRLR